MSSRMRRPESVTLQISRGDWLVVKKVLTAGETRGMFKRMMREGITGDQMDSVRVGWSKMISYLIDWSITDADDKPVVIRDQSEEAIGSALDALELESFTEILRAIEMHEDALEAARVREKKAAGESENKSSPISPSLSAVTGSTSG